MLGSSLPRSTAWGPVLDGDRAWLIKRDEVAAGWLVHRSIVERSGLVVQGVSHADHYREGKGIIAALAKRGSVATYKSPAGPGATFVSNADIRLLATAMTTARGFSLVATETRGLPLRGWAMATGAVDLSTGQVTADERSAEQIDLIAHMADQLYNGWSHKEVGRRTSARVLPELARSGMSYPVFVGSLIALDPRHLDSTRDLDAMKKALPPVWKREAEVLSRSWRL